MLNFQESRIINFFEKNIRYDSFIVNFNNVKKKRVLHGLSHICSNRPAVHTHHYRSNGYD